MSFIKYIPPGSFSDLPTKYHIVKSSSKRSDLYEFSKKGSLFDYDKILSELKPGELPVHLIALGCDEVFGPNKNGDAFTKQACRDYHKTFVKLARWFREHDHTDRKRSYGVVKASAFNEKNGWIELIVALNATKEAAKRNGGRVADEEIDLLERGKDLAVSMACVVDPNTPILSEKGYVPISVVQAGELVLTHRGRLRPVTEVLRRSYRGDIITLKLSHLPEGLNELKLTADHPLLVKRNNARKASATWLAASELSLGDQLCSIYNISEKIDVLCLFEINDCITDNLTETRENLLKYFSSPRSTVSSCEVLFWDLVLNCYNVQHKFSREGDNYVCSIVSTETNFENFINSLYDGIYLPSIKIIGIYKEYNKECLVYNLEVLDDHSYYLNNIISHNCKVAYDVCSGCGHRSKTREEYCDEKTCTKYGGLKHNLSKTFEDGHTLRAFNPEPYFFDISYVAIPADRIAYTLGVIKRATKVGCPNWLYGPNSDEDILRQLDILKNLALHEKRVFSNLDGKLVLAFQENVYTFGDNLSELLYHMDVPELVHELSKLHIILPVSKFAECLAGVDKTRAKKVASTVKPHLRGIFNELLESPDVLDILARNVFFPKEPLKSKDIIVLEKVGSNVSLDSSDTAYRYEKARMQNVKSAAFLVPNENENAKELAKLYGLYQLASLVNWKGNLPYNLVVTMNTV